MTFKELANQLMEQGWRAYHIENVDELTRGSFLEMIANRVNIEVQTFEGKTIIFIKNTKPKKDDI